jgi:archaemetzincin
MELRRKRTKNSKSILIFILMLLFGCNENVEINKAIKIEKKQVTKSKITQEQKSPELFIDIQPYEGIDKELCTYILNELHKVYPQVDLLSAIQLPKSAYYKPRNRFSADTLVKLQKKLAKPNHLILGLTHEDICTKSNGVYDYGILGYAYQSSNTCVVSSKRLKNPNLKEQFYKVAIHELGHTQGLDHCPDKTCTMTDAEGKNNTNNEKGFCVKCKFHLIKKGFVL